MAKKDENPEIVDSGIVDIVGAATAPAVRDGDVISKYIRLESEDTRVPETAAHQAIIDEIMSVDSLDDLLATTEAQSLEEFVGRRITVGGFSTNESDFPEGPPVYLSVKVRDMDSGSKHVINVGEQSVMAQLLRADQLGLMPFDCRPIQASRPNKYGRYPMRLGKVED